MIENCVAMYSKTITVFIILLIQNGYQFGFLWKKVFSNFDSPQLKFWLSPFHINEGKHEKKKKSYSYISSKLTLIQENKILIVNDLAYFQKQMEEENL